MTPERLARLRTCYRDGLLEDTLPFWRKHAPDREHGGFLFCLDRDGGVLDTDKGMWQHGRFVWLLSTLYQTVEPRQEWLELARHGLDFLLQHGFDQDGRMFFQVTQDGRPLRKRRYLFTETFAVMALAAYAQAASDEAYAQRARDLFARVLHQARTPGLLEPKVDPQTRPSKSLALPMVLLSTAQVLRETCGDPTAEPCIDQCIQEIRQDFVHHEHEAVLETVGPNGEILDHFDGRTLNPGHAIEAAWFVLKEAARRDNDPDLVQLGTTMLDWMWKRGWDEEHGGLFYYRDLRDLPVQEYWHDMKFWWPHNEAVLGTLWAWRHTGDPKWAQRHQLVHDWAHAHFPDPVHGEWYGYLHRDGRVSVPLKGNLWKGPFHLPRMQLLGWRLVEELQQDTALKKE